ncbi:hypothetical protein MUO14_15895 [Halobacillus shinanisalinarum]|uniref:Uncharacterized protein n=1 Tax=Halobacillus shinanisalinarum TaxID=2932258 RepID=A0ABY4GVH7_9BACI|nr:hypothetical protein [Halobacillus shinanisalinarum]UOQ91979.1 hypothetical protein MUO14_15895 [Halobacillus shinanisalinarum]
MPEAVQHLLQNWKPDHIFQRIVLDIKKRGVTDAQVLQMFEQNRAALFSS